MGTALVYTAMYNYTKLYKSTYIYIWLQDNYVKEKIYHSFTGLRCPEGSKKLRFPDYVTMAEEGSKVVSLTHRPLLLPRNTPGTHFCLRLSRPQGHSTIGRILCQ